MKPRLAKLSLVVGGAVLALHAYAQSPAQTPAQPDNVATAATHKAAAGAARTSVAASPTTTIAANAVKAASPAPSGRMVTAAGSVLMLSDGVVTHANIARVHPPAPGFVYER